MHLRLAQIFVLNMLEGANLARDYRAPHANRGTPPRPRMKRQASYVFSKKHNDMIPKRRPFRGHRV